MTSPPLRSGEMDELLTAAIEGEVAVVFGHDPPVVSFETWECADVSEVSTPRSDAYRFSF